MTWTSARPVVAAWRGLRKEWTGTPTASLIKAGTILAFGALVCAAWTWLVSTVGRWLEPRGMGAWDRRIFQWMDENQFVEFTWGILWESPGNAAYLVPLTVLAAILLAKRGKALAGLAVLISYWGARPLVFVGWAAWSRERPDLIADGIAAPGYHSFPSGHATLATAAYGFLLFLWMRSSKSIGEKVVAAIIVSVWILLVGWARVRLGSHWPSDIPAGIAVGVPWVVVVALSLRAAESGGSRAPSNSAIRMGR